MNLQNFLDYKTNCMFCNCNLSIGFCLYKHLGIYFIEDDLYLKLNNNLYNYSFALSFNLNNNSFFIDFYKDCYLFNNYLPLSILDRFKQFNKNKKTYFFTKQCNSCKRYLYTSNSFIIDKSTNIGQLNIESEVYILERNNDHMCLNINHPLNISSIKLCNEFNQYKNIQNYFNNKMFDFQFKKAFNVTNEKEIVDYIDKLLLIS